MMSAQTQAHPPPYHAYPYPYPAPLPFPPSATLSSYDQHHQHQFLDDLTYNSAPNYPNLTDAYMNPTLPQPPIQQAFYTSPHHGVKRTAPDAADDDLDRSSHISTQLKRLRLHNNQQESHAPLPHNNTATTQPHPSTSHGLTTSPQNRHPFHPPSPTFSESPHPPTLPSGDFMTIDDTPHKIYISDLDSEIAAIEEAERSTHQLFLPDFEKQIGAIPDHVLQSNQPKGKSSGDGSEANNKALVLYQEPSSISVPEEEDAVRKAVLDARRGIRERMRKDQQRDRETARVGSIGGDGPPSPLRTRLTISFRPEGPKLERDSGTEDDYDAMEIE